MATFGKPLKDVPAAISVDYIVGLKQTAPGIFQVVQIDQALLTNGASPADLNVLRDRVVGTETNIATLGAVKADVTALTTLTGRVTASEGAVATLDSSLSSVRSNTDMLTGALVTRNTVGDITAAVGTTTLAGTTTRLFGQSFTEAGLLARVGVWGAAGGSLKIKVMSPSGALWDVVASVTVTLAASVMNYFSSTALGSLQNYPMQKGWTIGFYGVGLMSGTTGISGDTYAIAGDAAGTGNAASAATSRMRAFAELTPIVPIATQVPALRSDVNALKQDVRLTLGGFAPVDTGVYFTVAQTAATRAPIWNIPFAGVVTGIEIVTAEAAVGVLQTLVREPGGNYHVTNETNIVVAGGAQTIAVDNLPFEADGAIAIRGLRVAYSTGYHSNLSNAGALAIGTSYAMSDSGTSKMQMRAIVATSSKDFSEGRGVLAYPLTTVSDFANVGTWTPAAAGVTPAGAGVEHLRHRLPSCTDRCSTTVKVKLTAISNIVGLVRFPVEALAYGAIGEVDFGANTIKLYRWDGTTRTVDASAALTVPGVLGRTYVLELPKNRTTVSFSVTDTVTRQSQTVSFGPPAGTSDVGTRAWGYPGLWSVNSAAVYSQFSHRVLVTKRPRLMLIGDSITEAQNLGSDVVYREANLLETSLGQTVGVGARGGANERDMMARFRLDVWLWRPEWVRLLLGTNDRDVNNLEAWSNRIIDIIRYCQALGIKVIIGTLPPNSTNQAFLTSCNNFILSGGFGSDVRIADYAQALSNGNDRVTQNTSLFLGDFTHPNKNGHAVMAAQLLCDVPELRDI